MRIKAAVIRQMGLPQPYAQSRPMSIEEVDLAPPQQREVLVQVKAASLCHSDLSTVNADRPRQMPMVLGHEAAGIVAEVGPGITDLSVGDHVVMVFAPSCGECVACPGRNPTAPARCWAAACVSPRTGRRSITTWGFRASPSTAWSIAGRW
jgi:alcohol dehydrogenase